MSHPTDLFGKTEKSPLPYIEINQRSREEKVGDKGAILVCFDWQTHIKFMKKISPQYEKSFQTVFSKHFMPILHGVSSDEDINRAVNSSLLSVRVTLSSTLGNSNASIVLENFNYQWSFLDADVKSLIPSLYGTSLFSEGLYVTIDAKGRFNSDRYYRIFTGVVSGLVDTDDPVDRRVSLSLVDYSRFLRFSRYNIHPAVRTADALATQSIVTVFTTALAKKDNVEIANLIIPDKNSKSFSNKDKINTDFKDMWVSPGEFPSYFYRNVPTKFGSALVVDNTFSHSYSVSDSSFDSKKNSFQPLKLIWGDYDVTSKSKRKYKVYAALFSSLTLFNDEFKTRADILKESAQITFFSCFIDGSGNIHFHDPRYSYVNISEYPYTIPLIDFSTGEREHESVYVLLEDESQTESYTQTEDDIVTRIWVLPETDLGLFTLLRAVHPNLARINLVWDEGVKRFGLRERTIGTSAFQDDPKRGTKDVLNSIAIFGLSCFVRLLLERRKMSTTMPMRAELQVDRPFYVPHKNMVYHIVSITHSYQAGTDRSAGTYTTAVDCIGGRTLEEATLLFPNLFKDFDLSKLKAVFKDAGYNILTNEKEIIKAAQEEVAKRLKAAR